MFYPKGRLFYRGGKEEDQKRMITLDKIKEYIKQNDTNPIPRIGGLNFYVTYMRIVLENENIDLDTWDYKYSDEDRQLARQRVDTLIKKVL